MDADPRDACSRWRRVALATVASLRSGVASPTFRRATVSAVVDLIFRRERPGRTRRVWTPPTCLPERSSRRERLRPSSGRRSRPTGRSSRWSRSRSRATIRSARRADWSSGVGSTTLRRGDRCSASPTRRMPAWCRSARPSATRPATARPMRSRSRTPAGRSVRHLARAGPGGERPGLRTPDLRHDDRRLADPVGLVVREAVFEEGDAHCCPSATRSRSWSSAPRVGRSFRRSNNPRESGGLGDRRLDFRRLGSLPRFRPPFQRPLRHRPSLTRFRPIRGKVARVGSST